jgi:RNA recognition motif-containing protein
MAGPSSVSMHSYSGEPCVNIFVGNLAFTTREQDLRQLFEPYGTVETARIMTDPRDRPLPGLWLRRDAGEPCGA